MIQSLYFIEKLLNLNYEEIYRDNWLKKIQNKVLRYCVTSSIYMCEPLSVSPIVDKLESASRAIVIGFSRIIIIYKDAGNSKACMI
jgi:hypothetical protein